MEADLARYYHSSIYDYWDGQLSMWQLAARIRHLPVESACNAALGGDELTVGEYLLYDLVHIHTEKPHPQDPRVKRAEKVKNAQLKAAHERARDRRDRLGMRGSVLRK
ncbi:hypothetical protein [Nocardiopsis sp. NPDC058789]|uniref:hypothetical protein n=1 Tax=Nocardiopsis TaxID=2013 RepID=UPI003672491B